MARWWPVFLMKIAGVVKFFCSLDKCGRGKKSQNKIEPKKEIWFMYTL